MPVNLLLVTNTLAPGGAEAMLVRLARSLDRSRVRPVVACLKEPGALAAELQADGLEVHANLLAHKLDWRVIGRLGELAGPRGCLVAVGSGGDRMFWSALAGRRYRLPVIVWSHIFPTPDHLAFEWTNRRLYRWVNAFVALGRRHAEALADLEGVPRNRIHIIRNGIEVAPESPRASCCLPVPPDANEPTASTPLPSQGRGQGEGFLPTGTAPPDERSDLPPAPARRGEPGREVTIGLVANFRPDKDHGLFLEAARRVLAARPQARFVLVGDGPTRRDVEPLAARLPADRIILTGYRADARNLIRGMDVVCLTSAWQECLSIAMLEAMAEGKAFVAPRIGSLDEALIDGVTGRVFEPRTPERLAEVLIELIDYPQERERLGQAARELVTHKFTAQTMARGFEELIERLCGREGDGQEA